MSMLTAPTLIAHRGNAAEYPENTIESLRSALTLGLRYVEFDVHLSADLVPVVMHDVNLQRCAGIDRDALAMPWEELARIAVSEPTRLGEQFAHTLLPSLAQVVALLREFPQCTAFLEIKRASLRKFGHECVIDRIWSVIQPVAQQIVIISFDLPVLTLARSLMRLPIGWVLPEYSTSNAIQAEAVQPEYLFCDWHKLPTTTLWPGPWQWAIYEITQRAQIESLLARGISMMETMQVRQVQALLSLMKLSAMPMHATTATKPHTTPLG